MAYALAASELLGDVATPIAASLFGPLIAATSFALYLLLASERATLAGLLAAIANVAAAALVTAMVLVQISVNDVEAGLSPAVNEAFEHVEFGLDLSWDVFLVAGTILFSCAMLADPRFGRRFALPGIVLAAALRAQLRDVPDAAGLRGTRGSRSARRPVVRRGVGPGAAPSAADRTPRRRRLPRADRTSGDP